uniref:NAB domain-containing protein n=1 Tax=Cajanus cajan TaxID=3821 RepID=A0A151TWR1_CAJCA|nr:hypothetical protein KK1_010764 [Cajanus cajan]
MAEMKKNEPSHWWWLESHSNTRRSPWLQSTLAELNEKTKAMLKLIEEDADSFAQRAEMYYKKRPQLVSMVEDFYRTHRSLAERYDQVTGIRNQKTGGSPFSPLKHHQSDKLMSFADDNYDSYSESCGVEESGESEVYDPEQEEEDANDEVMGPRKEIERLVLNDELKQKSTDGGGVMMLREEVERVREENRGQKDHLKQKDQEKIEVIRHLSLAIDVLKQENVKMRSFIAKESSKWKNPFELNKLMRSLSGKLFNHFNGFAKFNHPSVVAL